MGRLMAKNWRQTLHLGVFSVALVAFAIPLAAHSQPVAKLPRIGVLWQTAPPPPVNPSMTELLQGLKKLGWEDGKSVVIEYRYAGSNAEHLAAFAAELVQLKVDVITTNADLSTRAAREATTTMPIVAVVGYPVESGFVKSLARPGGNITGVSFLADVLSMKRLELLKELLPRLSRVAVLWDPATHERQLKAVEAAARTLGLQAQVLRAQSPEELAPAFEAAAKARAEALLVLVSPMFSVNRPTFASLAARHRIPAMYFSRAWVESGGLVSYGFVPGEVFTLVADQIDRLA